MKKIILKKGLLLIITLAAWQTTQCQIINTYGGIGWPGYTGDGGPATSAGLNHPIEINCDLAGNLLIADYYNNCVRKINTSGIITTAAGTGSPGYSGDGGPATAAQFNGVYGVCVDHTGNIYVTDNGNWVIRKVNTSGIVTTIAGTGIPGYSGDGGPATGAQIGGTTFIRTDVTGNIYFADNSNQVVRMINTSGIITTIAGNGTIGYSGDGGPATNAQLNYPVGVYPDNLGNLYIGDGLNNVTRKVNSSGIITTIAGTGAAGFSGDGGPATDATFNTSNDVITDAAGNIYIADNLNNRVRKINASGIITTIIGTGIPGFSGDGGPATVAQLYNVNGLAINSSGQFFIADVLNNRIRTLTTAPSLFYYTGGDARTLLICNTEVPAPVNIDTLLSVYDLNSGHSVTWSVVLAPAHGTVTGPYSMTSTGGIITPSGFSYTPSSIFIGTDVFRICAKDGTLTDTITINVTLSFNPSAGVIAGTDSICQGQTDTLNESATGGNWNLSSTVYAAITTDGIVTGLLTGADTVIYTVTNSCGTATAWFAVNVKSYDACHTGIINVGNAGNQHLSIFPDPATGEISVASNDEIRQLKITDLNGKEIFTGKYQAQLVSLNISALPAGIYFIKVNGLEVRKFVKQ